MPTPNSRKGTARGRTRAITDLFRGRTRTEPGQLVSLTDLLAGKTAPTMSFPEPLVRAAHVVGPAVTAAGRVPDTNRAAAVRARVSTAQTSLPGVIVGDLPARPRPVGLAAIVAELLDECATDEGVDALQHTPGLPGSAVMNPVSRAIARAVRGSCWIGDEHRYAVVQRGDVLARVELPGRLQALLDSIELRPELYPDVRPAAAA
jgi:hypothetical protein